MLWQEAPIDRVHNIRGANENGHVQHLTELGEIKSYIPVITNSRIEIMSEKVKYRKVLAMPWKVSWVRK